MTDGAMPWTGKWRSKDFQLGPQTGRGGMAVVHKAVHGPSGGTYAIKIVSPRTKRDREHLEREIPLSLRVVSPHVIRTYGSEKVGPDVWIIMEYVEGRSLKDLLLERFTQRDRYPFFAVPAYLDLFRSITLGLQAIHRAGIVHCDVKPENILLAGENVRLHDFGIARENFSPPDEISGTMTYMAPEQIRLQPVDQRTDFYSLGVVMYELAVGIAPFVPEEWAEIPRGLDRTRLTMAERWSLLDRYLELRARAASADGGNGSSGRAQASLLEQHKHAVARLPASFPYPPAIGKTLLRCLGKDRRERWNSAQELLEQIDELRTSRLDEY